MHAKILIFASLAREYYIYSLNMHQHQRQCFVALIIILLLPLLLFLSFFFYAHVQRIFTISARSPDRVHARYTSCVPVIQFYYTRQLKRCKLGEMKDTPRETISLLRILQALQQTGPLARQTRLDATPRLDTCRQSSSVNNTREKQTIFKREGKIMHISVVVVVVIVESSAK